MRDARGGRVRAEVTSTEMVGKVRVRIWRSNGETQEEPTERQARTERAGRPEVDGSGPRAPTTRNRVPAPRKPGRSP
jgi:hypothetical protein